MLFHLLERFAGQYKVLNVVHYITFRTAVASLTAFAISLFFGPWLIRRHPRQPAIDNRQRFTH